MIERKARHPHIQHRGPGGDPAIAVMAEPGKSPPEPDDDAGNAAVAHQKVRADPDHSDRNRRIEPAQKFREIGFVGRGEQHLGRPAGAKPGEFGKAAIGLDPAARLGQAADQRLAIERGGQPPPFRPPPGPPGRGLRAAWAVHRPIG